MLFIVGIVTLFMPLLMGLGSAVIIPLQADDTPLRRMGLCGIAGLIVLAILGLIGNFFTPLYPIWPCLAWLLGGALCIRNAKWLFRDVTLRDALAILLFLTILSLYAVRPLEFAFDTGLYHAQTVKWIAQSKVVPGLANLHNRLGYNSIWHIVAAMLEGPGLQDRSAYLLNTIMAAFWGMLIFDSAKRIISGEFRAGTIVLFLSLYPLAIFGISQRQIPSLNADLAAMMLVIVSVALWLEPHESPKEDAAAGALVLLLAAFAMTVKLSTAPLLPLAVAVAITRARRVSGSRGIKPMMTVAIAGSALLIAAWMTRGLALSGHALYPSAALSINTPWTVPADATLQDALWIKAWARQPAKEYQEVLASNAWLSEWLSSRLRYYETILPPLAVIAGIALYLFPKRRTRQPVPPRVWLGLFTAIAGTLFWLITAPDPRFGYGFLFLLGVLALWIGLWVNRLPEVPPIYRSAAVVLWAGSMMVWSYALPKYWSARTLLAKPGMPRVTMLEHHTPAGWKVWIPARGTQAWAAKLPSAPAPIIDPTLQCTLGSNGIPTMFWRQKP